MLFSWLSVLFFFFNDTATTEIYTLSLHDALPISVGVEKTAAIGAPFFDDLLRGYRALDRKSTRLNSSHVAISYAVFCLKKKKQDNINLYINTKHQRIASHIIAGIDLFLLVKSGILNLFVLADCFEVFFFFFFFNDTATTEIYTLSLHDALPISANEFSQRLFSHYYGSNRGRRCYRSEEHTSELQSRGHLVCRLLLEKKKKKHKRNPGLRKKKCPNHSRAG